jgi:hypothetical protein
MIRRLPVEKVKDTLPAHSLKRKAFEKSNLGTKLQIVRFQHEALDVTLLNIECTLYVMSLCNIDGRSQIQK